MRRLKAGALVGLLALGGFFETGCSSFVRDRGQDLAQGLLEKSKAWVASEISTALPKLEEKLTGIVEAKMAEREAKDLASLDLELAKLGTVDPVTGARLAKTWRDFDLDKSGHLEGAELLRVTGYVTLEGGKRVAAGQMTKDEFLGMEKGTATTVGGLSLAAVSAWAINQRRKKKAAAAPKPVAAGPPGPTPPAPAAAPGG